MQVLLCLHNLDVDFCSYIFKNVIDLPVKVIIESFQA